MKSGKSKGKSQRRVLLFTFYFSLSTFAFALASCTKQAAPPEDLTVWQTRGKWSGHGDQQTDPFISTTGLLRLTWEARGPDNVGTFRIIVHSDVSGRPLLTAVDRRGPGKDVTYVTEDPRGFFLVIESKDLQWSVEVAEGIPARRNRPTGDR